METLKIADNTHLLLRTNLKQLKLPAMGAEFEKLAREAAAANEAYEQYLLRLTEMEVTARSANAVQTRIRNAGFPVLKDFDTFDFTAVPSLNKPKVLELARGEWINERSNACLIGAPGTGKTHVAIALGLAACRQGKRVRFVTAGALVTQLEEAQKRSTVRSDSSIDSTSWSATSSVISRSAVAAPSYSSRCLPIVTNARACSSPATWRSANGTRSFKVNG